MAGAKLEYDGTAVQTDTRRAISQLERPAPLFAIINEYLLQVHRQRFRDQTSPDGTPWAALSPRYQKRKHRNRNKILTLRGHLQGTLRGQWDDSGLEFGTNRIYGAIHQFGGSIQKGPRTHTAFFRRNRDGSVGNRFVKKRNSNFAQDVNIGEHEVNMPARPWLGTSEKDDRTLLEKAQDYLASAFR